MAALLAATPASATEIHWLSWTNPCTNAAVLRVVDPASVDSVDVTDCHQAGTPLRDLDYMDLYGSPVTGGAYRLLARKDERGMECVRDSIPYDTGGIGWHFYVAPVDTAGNGYCISNIVYFGPVTGVPTGEGFAVDPVKRVQLFDVRGRLVRCHPASGIYFEKTTYKSGRTSVRRVPLVK